MTRLHQLGWAGILFCITVLPLVFNPFATTPFEQPKAHFLWAIALFLLLVYTITTLGRGAKSAPYPTRLLIIYGALYGVATLLSEDAHLSFWGGEDRHGLLTQYSSIMVGLSLLHWVKTTQHVEAIFASIILGSIPVCLYGLLQIAGKDVLVWQSDAVSPMLSTLGRPNFVAAYLALQVPLVWALWSRMAHLRWQWATIIALQMTCVLLTRARAGWLALIIGLLVAVTGSLIAQSKWRKALWAGLIILGLGLSGYAGFEGIFRPKTIPHPHTQTRIAYQEIRTASIDRRVLIWNNTLSLIPGAGLFGYGPETYSAVFAADFPTGSLFDGQDALITDPHNLLLHLVMDSGYLGAACFILMVLLIGGRLGWRGLNTPNPRPSSLIWGIMGALTAWLIQAQFNPDAVTLTAFFWVLIGLAIVQIEPHLTEKRELYVA